MKVIQEFIVNRYCCMHDRCGKEYTTKVNLKRHMVISHVQTRKFTCDRCERCFASRQNLIEHSYLHSGEKPYECVHCKEKFRHVSSLSLHYKFHREGFQPPLSNLERQSEAETQTYQFN